VEAVVRLMRRFSAADNCLTLKACVFGAEELGLLGSRFFVAEAKLRDELAQVHAVVNIDAIGRGDQLMVQTPAGAFRELADREIETHRVRDRWDVLIGDPGPGSDHYPFALEGVPSAAILQFPYGEYHHVSDRPDIIDTGDVDVCVALAGSIVAELVEGASVR
jgi:Zn-dependent M28 family amino/carboxypeptidase